MKEIRICLNMIVKNEEKVIERCLNSVKDVIDALVISDTGSEDNTVKVMNKWKGKHDKLGKIVQHKWKNFAHNRTLAIDSAQEWIQDNKKKDENWYVLIIDADDFLEIKNKEELVKEIKNLDLDYYLIDMQCGTVVYSRTFLVRIDKLEWKWTSALHEYLTAPGQKFNKGKIKHAYIQASRDGARSQDPMKYFKDALVLEEELKNDSTNTRYTFYLAQSYRDCKEPRFLKMAEELYLKRADMGGWVEERYISLVEAAKCRMWRNKSDFKSIGYLERAICLRDNRLEAPFHLIQYYRINKLYRIGYLIGRNFLDKPFPSDTLFVQKDIHDWKFWDELALCAYFSNDKKLYIKLCNRILGVKDLPNATRDRISRDLKQYT